MVLAGFVIAVGVVVDDAIIDIENIVRRLRQHRAAGGDRVDVARSSSRRRSRCGGAIVYATLIIVLAVIPIFFITGVSGAFFKPLALSYGLAVLASMVVALTVTPALRCSCSRGRRSSEQRAAARAPAAARLRGRCCGASSAAPRVVIAAAVGDARRRPSRSCRSWASRCSRRSRSATSWLHWITQAGHVGHQEIVRITERGQPRAAAPSPASRNFGTHIGQAFLADEIAGVNFGENWISIDPNANYDKTLAQIQDVVDGYPGLFHDVRRPTSTSGSTRCSRARARRSSSASSAPT